MKYSALACLLLLVTVLALPLMAQYPAPDTYNNLWYPYCGPTGVNRSVNLCTPPDGAGFDSRTQTITMRITDTHWPISYNMTVNGRQIYPQSQTIGSLDFISIVPLDTTVSGPQTVKYTFHDAAGNFTKTFTWNNDPSPCSTPTTDKTINLCTLTEGQSVQSPVHVGYAVNDSSTGTVYSSIWVDGVQLGSFNTGKDIRSSNDWVMMYPGKHRVTVQAHTQGEASFKTTVDVTVTAPTDVCKPDRTTDPGVTICGLTDGQTVTSPVRVQANGGGPYTLTQVYVDGQAVFTEHAKEIDTNVTMTPGTHRLTVQSKSNSLGTYKKTIYITVQ